MISVPVRSRKDQEARGAQAGERKPAVQFGDFQIDFARRELRKLGIRVRLEPKPFLILEILLRHPGELVTRQDLMDLLWPNLNVSFARGLNTAVNSLRRALGDSFHDSRLIETRNGLGYRFTAPVRKVVESQDAASLASMREAHEDCLKGRFFLDRITEADAHKAISFFRSALMHHNSSAQAHAGMADAYCQLALFRSARSCELERHATEAAQMALQLDHDLAEAHVAWGHVRLFFHWNCADAHEAVSRALALEPRCISAMLLQVVTLAVAGDCDEALDHCRQAVAIDPLSFSANTLLAACLYAIRDFEGVIDQCWKILTLASGFAPAELLLALAYEQLGMFDEAVVEFENAQQCAGFEMAAAGGLAHAQMRAEPHPPAPVNSGYHAALVDLARGDTTQAIARLEKCLADRNPAVLWLAADARFHAIRMDRRLHSVLATINQSPAVYDDDSLQTKPASA